MSVALILVVSQLRNMSGAAYNMDFLRVHAGRCFEHLEDHVCAAQLVDITASESVGTRGAAYEPQVLISRRGLDAYHFKRLFHIKRMSLVVLQNS